MMVEQGVVTAVKGNRATVRVDKKDECSKCGMCLFPKGASSIDLLENAKKELGIPASKTKPTQFGTQGQASAE